MKLIKEQEEYREYITTAKGLHFVLLSADNCLPCKLITASIEELEQSDQDKFVKVNLSYSRELRLAFNIRSIPTILTYFDDEIIDIRPGSLSKDALKVHIKSFTK